MHSEGLTDDPVIIYASPDVSLQPMHAYKLCTHHSQCIHVLLQSCRSITYCNMELANV